MLRPYKCAFDCNYSEGGQKIKKPCPAYFSNDYIENLILNWREN